MAKIDEIKMLRLGQRDENLARSLTFDCSDWLEQYPEASIHILFRRPGESAIVPMSTTLEGTTLTWLIHDYEVGKTGVGNAEFRAVDTAGLRRKSRIIPCSIEETLLGGDETVLYTQDQVDETLAHISEAAQAAQAAKASEEAAALSAQEAGESAASAGTAADVAVGARDAAQAAQTAAETAQHQAEAAQSGVHADAEAAEQAKVAAQAAQASAQGAASQASADRTAAESARADAEAAAMHAEAVVEGIDQAGADQVAAVNAAGQAQVTAVNQAGATQVGNVNAAGTTQVNAVQAKGTQVINSIPADYSALTDEVTDLKSTLTSRYVMGTKPAIWHVGGLTADRGISYTATNRIFSNELQDDIRYVQVTSGYLFALYAYDESGYVGVWNGATFGKVAANIFWVSDNIFVPDGYKYRIVIKKTDNADMSTDDGLSVSFGYNTDKSLSIESKAADAKEVGDKITNVEELIATEKKVANSNSFVTNKTGADFLGVIVPRFVSGYYNIPGIGAVVDVSEPIEYKTLFATLFDIPDGYIVYADGIEGSVNARAYAYLDEDYKVISRSAENAVIDNTRMTPPNNAKYLIIQTKSLDNAYVVCYNGFVSALKNQYETVNDLITDFSTYKVSDALINTLRNWVRGTGYSGCFIPLGNGYGKSVTVSAGDSNAQVSFLTSDVAGRHNAAVDTFADGETARHVINANAIVTLNAPADCTFVFVSLISGGNYIGPDSISISMEQNVFSKAIEELSTKKSDDDTSKENIEVDVTRAIGLNNKNHDIPQNRGVLSGYKRVHQLNDIEWTALSAIPGHYSRDEIPAGDHVGFPYSEAKEYDKHVGFDVSIKTFMTAAHNPYSLLYTEDINGGSRSLSAYGITYHGLNCGAYFGIVCSIYSMFGVGAFIPWKTTQFAYLNRIGKFIKAYDQTSYGLRLLDIVWEPGHCCIITDIERDDFGKPTYIYWGESIGYFPIIHKYTFEESENRLKTKGGIIYYVPDLYKRLAYSPSEFVSVADEDPIVPYAYNDDICTYAGDYASFYEGENIYINYNAGNYTHLKVYKDGTLLNTTAIDSTLHAVQITVDGYGLYTATLSDGTNESEATHFEIVQANVSCTYSGGKLKVNFSSANGTPLYGQICYRSGVTRGIIELTETDIQRGYFECDPLKILHEQLWSQATFEETTYVKVFFKGQYGTVRNDFVDTGIYT